MSANDTSFKMSAGSAIASVQASPAIAAAFQGHPLVLTPKVTPPALTPLKVIQH